MLPLNNIKNNEKNINISDNNINIIINNNNNNNENNLYNNNINNINNEKINESLTDDERQLINNLQEKSISSIYSTNKEQYNKYINDPIFQEIINSLKEKREKNRIEKIDKIIEKLSDLIKTNITSEFYNYFFAFKKPMNLSFKKRKYKLDSLLKKCKGKFFRSLQRTFIMIYKMNKIKATLNRNFYVLVKMEEENIYKFFFNKIPLAFASSVNIELNKKYLNKSINEIYQDFDMYSSSPPITLNNIIELLYEEEKRYFEHIMTSKYSNLYYEYILSNMFKSNLHEIRKKEGEKYSYLFKYISFVFIKYFQLKRNSNKSISKSKERILEKNKFLISGLYNK